MALPRSVTRARRRLTLPKPFAVVVLIALSLIPLIYAAALIWSNNDPVGNIGNVPAAIVNLDTGATVEESAGSSSQIQLGDDVVSALVDANGDSKEGFDWTITDADTAQAGLTHGEYLAVLTIPADFSANATSSATVEPTDAAAAQQGMLSITTNDATNYITGNMAQSLGSTLVRNLAETVSSTYLENVYLGFTTVHDSISDAADGAATLADGTTDLSTGASALADGASTLAVGAGKLSSGLSQISSATDALPTGLSSLNAGIGQAVTGATDLSTGLATLQSGTSSLADGADRALTGATQLSGGLSTLDAATPTLAAGAAQVASSLDQFVAGYDTMTDPQRAAALQQLDTAAHQVSDGAGTLNSSVAALDAGAEDLVGTASEGTGLSALAAGAADVRDGTRAASAGATSLAAGLGSLGTGFDGLTVKLTTLVSSINTAASSSGELATGAQTLESGASSAADGAHQVDDGAHTLSTGLADGVLEIPTYTDSQANQLSGVAAAPVALDAERENAVALYGAGLTPYFLSLGLWIGSLAVFFMRPALNTRLVGSRLPLWLVALRSYLPNALIAVVQATLAVLAVKFAVGIEIANLPGAFGIAILASLTFMAINQALIALLGAPGRFVGLLFVVLQLSAAGGTYPIQTAAPFFQTLHNYLPLTDAVQSFRTLIAGGTLGVGPWVWNLVVWAIGALVAIGIAAFVSRRRLNRSEILAAAPLPVAVPQVA
ncbi:hypothetical protein GCM10022381_31150 [Leifsonia kafniensis]|uniref:ABC-2 type transporter transmembrane domain-containing protein n=1 Tax=Leifsonia kafniensis TaxID=475957 RepID=A0ABP7KTW6_9MICO